MKAGFALLRSVVLIGAWSAMASAAIVAPLEGPPLTATTITLTADTVLGDGKPLLALRDVDWLEFATATKIETPAVANANLQTGIWLTDGSWLPTTAIAAGTGDQLRVGSLFGKHEIPLSLISGWGTSETAPASDGQDRVLVSSGPIDGRVQGLRDGKLLIATSLDPEPLALELSEIQGLRLAQAVKRPTGSALLVTVDPNRPPVRLVSTATGLQLAASKQPVGVSTLSGLRVRVDGGRRTWLSEVTPATVVEKGAFDVVWPWQRDHALDGGPLALGGARYAKGITVHSAATLTWTLGQRSVRLRSLIGIADVVAPEGDCVVTIAGDGKPLWRTDHLRGGETPVTLDLDLRGVTTLSLDIALGERFDIGDHVMLADAYLVQLANPAPSAK